MSRIIRITLWAAVVTFFLGVGGALLWPRVKENFLASRTLKILCDESWLPQSLLEEYAAKSGLRFQFYSFNKPSEFVRQIANAGTQFDVICFHSSLAKSLIQTNVLKKINPRHLRNFDQISVDFHNLPFDREFEYSVPFFWNVHGFVVKNPPASNLSWRERWKSSARKIQLWPSELDIFFTLLQSGLETVEWTDENQTRKFAEYLKRFSDTLGGWARPDSLAVDLRDLGSRLDIIQIPSGRAGEIMSQNPELQYWTPEDGVAVSVALLGQGAQSERSKEGFQLIDWLLDGAQALKIQKFALGSVVQPALNNSDQLSDLQKSSLMRSLPASRLKFTDVQLDAVPRFEKLFREVESRRN